MRRALITLILLVAGPAAAQLLPLPGADVPYLNSATDVTAAGDMICGGEVRAASMSVVNIDAGMVTADAMVCRGAASTGPLAVDGGLTVSGDATLGGFTAFVDLAGQTLTCQDTTPFALTSLGGADVLGGLDLTCMPGRVQAGKPCLAVNDSATFDGGVWVGGALTVDGRAMLDAGVNVAGQRIELDASGTQYLQAGNPGTGQDAGAVEIGGLGAQMKMLLLQPMALGAIPACTTATRGARVAGLWPSGLSDGGFDAQGQECDGDHWITSRFLLGIAASPKAGSGAFWRLDPRYPGALTSIPGSVDTPGVGAGPLEVIVRQGSAVKCRGSLPSCASAAGTALRLDCGGTPALFTASPDGGAAYALIAEVDAGCAQTPGLDFAADVRRFGYPDPGWSP